jgi:hypothetical protein
MESFYMTAEWLALRQNFGCGGSVPLTRHVVAVPWGRDLVLHFLVPRAKPKSISLEHYEEEWTFKLGTYNCRLRLFGLVS